MLFFCSSGNCLECSFEMINQIIRQIKKVIMRNEKIRNATLQVRILINRFLKSRKRVSFFASASLTAEAAAALPLFLFAGVILMMPFRILDIERQVQASIEAVGEDISQTAYFSLENPEGREVLTSAAAYGYAEAAVRMKLGKLPVDRISLASSRLLADGETVELVVDYELRLPFSVFGLESVKRRNRCFRRAWIGKSGNEEGINNDGKDEDTIVYIGKNSTRYHERRDCHYLDNHLEIAAFAEIKDRRNKEGSKYTPCSRCGANAGAMVYIMESGRHYHSSADCTAIQAYVTAVPKSQVQYLGPCSYCSGGKYN